GIALGASALLLMSASPSYAADQATSEASASALQVSVAGKSVDVVSQIHAIYDGVEQITTGRKLPVPNAAIDQDFVSAGVLGQDAIANSGSAAACAGLVASSGALKLGADGSCVVSGDGEV